MKKPAFVLLVAVLYSAVSFSQDVPTLTEQQLENLTAIDDVETEDDAYLLQLEHFKKNPVNLNTADATELGELGIATDLQVANLLAYRRLVGDLISIYELQAVPAWDIMTIRKLLPYVTVALPVFSKEHWKKRLQEGEHSLLFRASQVLERSKGFERSSGETVYTGSPQRYYFRYQYRFKNLLQFGILGDKDAGEQFFKGAQRKGFDFYSFHLFARDAMNIAALAIGDFTVNMGQGLTHWQSLAFKKGADVMGIKRQSQVLRAYNSAGEFNFHRGAGITLKKRKTEFTAFVSLRKLSANLTVDTLSGKEIISSFLTSGYHRTAGEIADRNRLRQAAFGGNIKYSGDRFQAGFSGVYYHFSAPVQKRDEPYNLFALAGDSWYNLGADYSYTRRNFHFFGEAAVDKNFHRAFINGLLVSVDPRVDLSLLYRHINKEYQAVNANAFTESTSPSNESGLYAGVAVRPSYRWRLNMYADIYHFPWLKYQADAPGYGKDFLVQLMYAPNRQTEIYARYRNETKPANQPGNITVTNYLVQPARQNLRVQVNHSINNMITVRNRTEMTWYDRKGSNSETGFLSFFDIICRPPMKPYSFVLRMQYFETDGYNARLYAYENDVLYSHSVPAFFNRGVRYYMVMNCKLSRKISCWLRWARTVYRDKDQIGSGLDEIKMRRKTEIKVQLSYILKK